MFTQNKCPYWTNIVIEGCDGVGKTTLCNNLLKYFNYCIPVYDRGDISNYVYAKKYNRPFTGMQKHQNFIYLLLTADKEVIKNRIIKRKTFKEDIKKINDQDLFINSVDVLIKDYNIVMIDTTDKNEQQVLWYAIKYLQKYNNIIIKDKEETYSQWNKMYKKGCDLLHLDFSVIQNQPFINNLPIMGEANLHNGFYESFDNKNYPISLIYSLGYSRDIEHIPYENRKYDFSYIINSKILSRHEVYDYIDEISSHNYTCLVGKNSYFKKSPLIETCEKPIGDDYIKLLCNTRFTVYTARHLRHLEYVSVRLYQHILAENIIFVDKISDPDNKILKQIHGDNSLSKKLHCMPNDIAQKAFEISNDRKLVQKIIDNQNAWLKLQVENIIKHQIGLFSWEKQW